MNSYDKLIIKILLKICRILGKYSGVKNIDTMIYTIENDLKGEGNSNE